MQDLETKLGIAAEAYAHDKQEAIRKEKAQSLEKQQRDALLTDIKAQITLPAVQRASEFLISKQIRADVREGIETGHIHGVSLYIEPQIQSGHWASISFYNDAENDFLTCSVQLQKGCEPAVRRIELEKLTSEIVDREIEVFLHTVLVTNRT